MMAEGYRLGFAKTVWEEFNLARGPLASAAIAFYMTLTMIPLLLLLVSVAAFFISPADAQARIGELTAVLGPGISSALQDEAISIVRNRGLLTGISLLVGFWTGSKVFLFVIMALNQIWHARETRRFWVLYLLAFVMVIVIGMLLAIALVLAALFHVVDRFLRATSPALETVLIVAVSILLPLILITIVNAIMYRYLGVKRFTWREVLPGAIVAAVLWVILTLAFSWYSANFSNYSVVYGSLGELILLMLWFNYNAVILLLGAVIIQVLRERRGEAEAPT